MNNLQRAKLDTCNRVKDCITKFDTELSTINEFATEKTALMDALETISAAAKVQIDTSGAVADAVQAAKENMVAVVIKYARRGNVVANQNNNITLASELDHGITYLLRASKSMALHRAEVIRDHLNNHLATLTN
ncbi:MAG: hypothetical protein HYZ42_18885, partial [Bacteroidetes bacterium]|nr:hypothetical protein [Bacteroidota bacterium]